MTPIERVRAKIDAAEVLGVSQHARTGELRAAWQRAARSFHPDRNGGDSRSFVRARAAFEYLAEESADEAETRSRAPRPAMRRPTIARREMTMDPEEYLECIELLEQEEDRSDADHVPVEFVQSGRALVFRVSAPLADGLNRVALPTSLIEPHRRGKPTVLKFRARRAGAGLIQVPEALLEQRFPGTRSVTIEFSES